MQLSFTSNWLNELGWYSWIPMDASYKQYDYQEGMALSEAVPFDAQTSSLTENFILSKLTGDSEQ